MPCGRGARAGNVGAQLRCGVMIVVAPYLGRSTSPAAAGAIEHRKCARWSGGNTRCGRHLQYKRLVDESAEKKIDDYVLFSGKIKLRTALIEAGGSQRRCDIASSALSRQGTTWLIRHEDPSAPCWTH